MHPQNITHLKVDGDEERYQNYEQHLVPKVLTVPHGSLEIVRINIGDGDYHSLSKESCKLGENFEKAMLGRFLCYPVAAILERSVFRGRLEQQDAFDGVLLPVDGSRARTDALLGPFLPCSVLPPRPQGRGGHFQLSDHLCLLREVLRPIS